jgi:hypothetical protein
MQNYDVNIYRSGKYEMSVCAYPLIVGEDGEMRADYENYEVLKLSSFEKEHKEAITWCLGFDEETETFKDWLDFEDEQFYATNLFLEFDVWDTDRILAEAPEPVYSWYKEKLI